MPVASSQRHGRELLQPPPHAFLSSITTHRQRCRPPRSHLEVGRGNHAQPISPAAHIVRQPALVRFLDSRGCGKSLRAVQSPQDIGRTLAQPLVVAVGSIALEAKRETSRPSWPAAWSSSCVGSRPHLRSYDFGPLRLHRRVPCPQVVQSVNCRSRAESSLELRKLNVLNLVNETPADDAVRHNRRSHDLHLCCAIVVRRPSWLLSTAGAAHGC